MIARLSFRLVLIVSFYLSRWFQFVDSTKRLCNIWSQRLIIYTYIAVSPGLHIGSPASEKLKVAMKTRNEDDDVEKSSIGNDRAEVRKTR